MFGDMGTDNLMRESVSVAKGLQLTPGQAETFNKIPRVRDRKSHTRGPVGAWGLGNMAGLWMRFAVTEGQIDMRALVLPQTGMSSEGFMGHLAI